MTKLNCSMALKNSLVEICTKDISKMENDMDLGLGHMQMVIKWKESGNMVYKMEDFKLLDLQEVLFSIVSLKMVS